MDYNTPKEVLNEMVEAGKVKSNSPVSNLLIKSMLAGALLGIATTLSYTVELQTKLPFLGAVFFPIGFVIIVLLGMELVTGNFALLPCSFLAKKVTLSKLIKNLSIVFIGNLIGSLLYGLLYYCIVTNMGINFNSPMVDKIRTVSEAKTIFYQNLGLSGWALAFIKGILCNWMVTLGTVLAFTSKSTIGKISAMGLPIIVFFTQGFEHAVVNMFVIPTGILLGSNATISGWLLFNQLPVTIGNFIGGCLLTGVSFYVMFREKEKNTKTMA